MKIFIPGDTAPGERLAEGRTRWRVVVFVLVLICMAWLVDRQHLPVSEAVATVAVLGAVAGGVLDRLVGAVVPLSIAIRNQATYRRTRAIA